METKLKDEPFTSSLSSDITLISSFLHGHQEAGFHAEPRDRKNIGLSLATKLSTLLTPDSSDPRALNFNAVIGSIEASSVQCVVFSNNYRPTSMENGAANPRNSQIISLEANSEQGRNLLYDWKNSTCDYDFDTHIQDVSHIFRYLQSTPKPNWDDYFRFQSFVHLRAFQSLSHRVLEFSEHWTVVPFKLMKDHVDDLVNGSEWAKESILPPPGSDLTKEFFLALDRTQYSLLSEHGLEGELLTPMDRCDDSQTARIRLYRYSVDPLNLSVWIDMFNALWRILETELLVTERVGRPLSPGSASPEASSGSTTSKSARAFLPDPDKIPLICRSIGILYVLKPVLMHVLSVHGNQNLLRRLQIAEDRANHGWKKNSSGESIKGVYDFLRDPEFIAESGESSAARVIRLLERVVVWHGSVVSVWAKLYKSFSKKRIEFHQFRYDATRAIEVDPPYIRKVLDQIDPLRHWTHSDIQTIQKNAVLASIHAEAALMGWAFVSFPAISSSTANILPVGTMHKCCRSCSLFQEALNEETSNTPTFALPGTHSILCSWTPPPGVPDRVLLRLRRKLLQIVEATISSHSKRYSHSLPVVLPAGVEYFKSLQTFGDVRKLGSCT